jgi:hypothetical protein
MRKKFILLDEDDYTSVKSSIKNALINLQHIEDSYFKGEAQRKLEEALNILDEEGMSSE